MSVLRKGDRGTNVKELQQLLSKAGFNVGDDGTFGLKTEMAVKQFQAKQNLHVDGIVGRRTLAALGKPVTTRAPQPPISGSAGRQAVGAMDISASGMSSFFIVKPGRTKAVICTGQAAQAALRLGRATI